MGGRSSQSGGDLGVWGVHVLLKPFPVSYGDGGIAERPGPTPGEMTLACLVLPGVGMKWGQDHGLLLMAPRGHRDSSRGSHSGWEIPDIRMNE